MTTKRGIKLVLADVDGTLVTDDKVLTADARAAARALHDAGVILAITSGRPPLGMSMLIEPLALKAPIAGFNGGALVEPDLSLIETLTLDPDAASQTLELMLDQGLDAWIYTADAWLVRNADAPHVAREAWTVKFDAQVVGAFTDAHLAGAVKIVGVSDDVELIARTERIVQNVMGARASAARSQPYYLDVTNRQANKGSVIDTLATRLDIAPEQMATIGDMPNDVAMFEKSGFSIAMGNASDAVKARAHVVTDSNNREGFARAVDRFILGRSP